MIQSIFNITISWGRKVTTLLRHSSFKGPSTPEVKIPSVTVSAITGDKMVLSNFYRQGPLNIPKHRCLLEGQDIHLQVVCTSFGGILLLFAHFFVRCFCNRTRNALVVWVLCAVLFDRGRLLLFVQRFFVQREIHLLFVHFVRCFLVERGILACCVCILRVIRSDLTTELYESYGSTNQFYRW